MTYLVIVAFLAIIGSLAVALVFMLRSGGSSQGVDNTVSDTSRGRRMAWALACRVGFSVLLFLAILIGYQLGWIRPTGLPV